MAGKRLSAAEFNLRLRTVYELKLAGHGVTQMRAIVGQPHTLEDGTERPGWKASLKTIRRYQARAGKLARKLCEDTIRDGFGYQILRREKLFNAAWGAGDYNACLQISKDACQLAGFYDQKWADRIKEVERVLGIGGAQIPVGADREGVGPAAVGPTPAVPPAPGEPIIVSF